MPTEAVTGGSHGDVWSVVTTCFHVPGEAMEKGLRECCRSMRIGKILIRRDQETRQPRVREGRRGREGRESE